MKRHERVHTGDKPFSCSQCDKKFALAYILKTHKRIHIDEKPFSCKRCDYKCKQSIALKTHERIHTDEKPFSCSQCGYKCSTSGSLRRMYEPTLVISHSAAKSVITNANNQVHWMHTKESTPMRNHSAFIFSKCDKVLVSQVAKLAFTNMLGRSQEPTIYSSRAKWSKSHQWFQWIAEESSNESRIIPSANLYSSNILSQFHPYSSFKRVVKNLRALLCCSNNKKEERLRSNFALSHVLRATLAN